MQPHPGAFCSCISYPAACSQARLERTGWLANHSTAETARQQQCVQLMLCFASRVKGIQFCNQAPPPASSEPNDEEFCLTAATLLAFLTQTAPMSQQRRFFVLSETCSVSEKESMVGRVVTDRQTAAALQFSATGAASRSRGGPPQSTGHDSNHTSRTILIT